MLRFVALLVLASFAVAGAADDKPYNFVFILADDYGCRDLSGEGSSFYETPNLDRLAAEGVKFTNGYAACQVCSPSRASIMTGKYPARLHITDWIGAASGFGWKRNGKILPAAYEHSLPADDVTLAEALREGGYATFFAGKWHLGGEGSFPEDHGFDINKGGHHRGSPPGGFFAPYKNPKLEDGEPGESLTLRLAKETTSFIKQSADKPFLAYLSFYTVHGPIQTTPDLWKKYRDKAEAAGLADNRFKFDRTLPVRQVQDCPIYAGMVETMDTAVGMVMKQLEESGVADRTVVIFTSDNGGVSSGDAFSTSNLPFRGGKGRQWEGGIREPYYVKVPGWESREVATPVTGTDFYPTILELAGLPARPEQHADGVSLVPLLTGGKIADRDLFWHYPHYGNQGGDPSAIIRSGDWKLIHYWEDDHDELYHLPQDIGEESDLAAQHPDRVAELRTKLFEWLYDVRAAIPAPDHRFDEARYEKWLEDNRTRRLERLEKQHANFLHPRFTPNKDWWGSVRD